MPISSIFWWSHPAELRVVGIVTLPSESPDRSARKRLSPCPPVITLTPDTWAFFTSMNSEAPAVEAKSTTNRAAFCLVGPIEPASIDSSCEGISTSLGHSIAPSMRRRLDLGWQTFSSILLHAVVRRRKRPCRRPWYSSASQRYH